MNYFTFLPEGASNCNVFAWLQTQPCDLRKLPAIVICPGGGYERISQRESTPVAKEYFAAGYQTFVLEYSVNDNAANLAPLFQLAATVSHIRNHADQWNIDPQCIAVCGFSAGGHLAASLGTLFNKTEFRSPWHREDLIRPDAMVLCYPVILADEYVHTGSIKNVSGKEPGTVEYRWFGLDQHVDAKTPPAFLWHTAEDTSVPVQNSLRFAAALSNASIPYELHIFPHGPHGMSVCTREVGAEDSYNHRWVEWSIRWLNKQFLFQK